MDMKIAQVSPLFESVPPKLYGGTERVVSWLTEELVRKGHEVTLFASGDSTTSARLISACSNALRLDKNCKDTLVSHILSLQHLISMRDEFDIIHFHFDYLHFPIARELKIPGITTLHSRMDIPEFAPVYAEFSDMPLVSISNSQREPIPFANWASTVYHGLPKDSFDLNETPKNYLAFLGRISPEKRPDRAIEIAIRSGIKVKIAAKIDASNLDYYNSIIKPLFAHPLVEYIGEINDSQKNEFLGNAKALLFPIDWPEPFGLVMIEALACGTPVIAYGCGSVPEIIEHEKTGFVVNSIEASVKAVHNIGQIDRKHCRGQFENRFSVERMTNDYLGVYERIIREFEADTKIPEVRWANLRSGELSPS